VKNRCALFLILTSFAFNSFAFSSFAAAEPCSIPEKQRPKIASALKKVIEVLRHPRCANCHGLINVFDPNTTHRGGSMLDYQVDPISGDKSPFALGAEACTQCHDAGAGKWDQAASPTIEIQWANLDDVNLCRRLQTTRIRVSQGSDITKTSTGGLLLKHIREDFLIALGFEGRRGIGKNTYLNYVPNPEPPGHSKQEFIRAMQTWVDAVGARKAWPPNACCNELLTDADEKKSCREVCLEWACGSKSSACARKGTICGDEKPPEFCGKGCAKQCK